MPTSGARVILDGGRYGIKLGSGRAKVFNASGDCDECCSACPGNCFPEVIGSWTTNGAHPTINLTPFQHYFAHPCAAWRLIEVGVCFPVGYPWYGAGCAGSDGRLLGVPSSFTSRFLYDGFLEFQIGCRQGDGTIDWPGSCQPTSDDFCSTPPSLSAGPGTAVSSFTAPTS